MQPDSRNSTSSSRPAARHSFNGQGRRGPKKAEKFSQASTRRGLHSFDQHGREWYVETEINSGRPTGPWQAQFDAPWKPDQIWFVLNPDNTAEMYIDYPAMRADRRSKNAEYHREAVKLAVEKKWEIPVYGQPYTPETIRTLGNPPHPIQPLIAAEQENPWIMGWSDRPDPRLVPHMPRKRMALSVEEEGYDFTEESYQAAVDHAPAQQRARAAQFTRPPEPVEEKDVFDNDPAVQSPLLVDETDVTAFDDDDAEMERLLDLEEEADPHATGGKAVPVQTDVKTAQAESRPARPPRPPQHGRHKPGTGANARGGRNRTGKPAANAPKATPQKPAKPPTIAQGARPVVAALTDE